MDYEIIDTEDGFCFVREDGDYRLIAYTGEEETITLPNSINGHSYKLWNFNGGKEIVIPDGWTEIGENAFQYNCVVETVVIPDSVTSIGSWAFANCQNLKEIYIPDSVDTIGLRAFQYCKKLTDVKLPNGLTRISVHMFESCSSLRDIWIPDTVTTIDRGAFWSCDQLVSVHIPDGVEKVDSYAFFKCYTLNELTIPASVTYIGEYAITDSGLYDNPKYWIDGMLIIDGWLLDVADDLAYLRNLEQIKNVGEHAYSDCYNLKNAVLGCTELSLSNMKTLVITDIYEGIQRAAATITLENIVILDSIGAGDFAKEQSLFCDVGNVTIFVESEEKDLRWDANFPGWSNGNKVIYGDNWIWVNFYDDDGTLLLSEPKRTSEVIRRPFVDKQDECYTYELIGWDLDGDGKPDTVPATSATDINAVAVYERGAPDHDFSGWTVVEEPTTTSEGLESWYCYHCGLEETRVIAQLENPFTDVPEDSFYHEPVLWAVANGITNGTSATTFGPNDQCMRAHVVTFLWRAAGSPEPESGDNPFTDVKTTDFFYKPVLWAVERGITNGISATAFGSYDVCNRAAVVTFLWRAAGSPEPSSGSHPFTDVKETDFFYKPVLWAVENGITNGIDATHFGPNSPCNRAQVVTFLYRAYN